MSDSDIARRFGSAEDTWGAAEPEEQFQLLANSIRQLAWMADSTGAIFWYNQRWYEYTGANPADMKGWGWQSVHDPEVLPQVVERWRESIATGEPFEMTFPLRGADGRFRPFLTQVVPLRSENGGVVRWFGTNTDVSAHVETEQALRSSKERLKASLDASGTGTFRWDILSGALDWDHSLDRLFGLAPGETVRNLTTFIECVHPDERAEVVSRCEHSAKTGDDFEMEFRVVWPDGAVRWLYDRGKTFLNRQGRPAWMTGACVDITERKHAELVLERRARISALAGDIGVALTTSRTLREMLRMCTDAVVARLGAAFARIWTVNAAGDTLELQASSGMYTHIDGGHARVPVGKFKIGRIAQTREPHLTNDVTHDPLVGDREWARREGLHAFAGYPLVVENSLIGVVALFAKAELGAETLESLGVIANSIALGIGRKRNEAALRESEARKAAILDISLDCIVTIDEQSRILEFNPAASATFGYSFEQALGAYMPDLIMPPDFRERHRHGLKRYLETGEAPIFGKRLELEGMRADGTRFPMELSVNPLRFSNGACFTATIRDITDRKRDQEELQRARTAAETANRSKSDFLASMSHELRTPLNAIIGYSEMLQEEAEELGAGALNQDLLKIHGAGRHLLSLISDILDLSKIEAGRMEIFPERFDVAAAVHGVANTIEALVEKNENVLTVNIADDIGWMYADLTKVRQILFNLLSNAAKFTERGSVTVDASRQTRDGIEMIRFVVSDTGMGIPADRIGELFQPFVQLGHTPGQTAGGTGLGLAITRRFCEMMGGDISLESELGIGSRFTVVLPRSMSSVEPEASRQPASRSHRESTSGRIVLVIDDNATARELMQRYLAHENFEVVLAANGEEGLRLARETRPDLITLDVLMPGMDGWAVLQALKADPDLARIPVIMASIVSDRGLGYALGATDFLVKPVDREQLSHILRQHQCPAGRCRILVVDDDPGSRELLASHLLKEDCEVEEAPDGAVALMAIERRRPDLILLDLLMPHLDGFAFTVELRKREEWRRIPVIVITSKDLTAEDRRRLNGNVERILLKGSFSEQELIREVRDLAEQTSKAYRNS